MAKSETFFKRAGTTDKGRDYENMVVAKIVLQLVNDDGVKDFHISSNDKKFGAFDDIVVKIESKSGIKIKALQLKHSDRKMLAQENLKSKKGDYSIRKYFESFQKIRNSVDEFILFTNRSFNVDDDTKFQLEEEEFSVKPVKVNDSVKISKNINYAYQFQIMENISSVEDTSRFKEYETFFNKFYLCSDQENLHDLKYTTRNEFKKTYSSNDDTFMKFYRVLAEWMVQEGKKEKLNKWWMQCLIALQILSRQIEPLSFGVVNEKMKIFRECISMFDVTIFGKESCRAIKLLWGDIDKKNVDFVQLNRTAKKYQLSSCYIDKTNIDTLNPKTFAQLLWLMKKCPLVVHGNENTENIIQFCPNRNFILLDESVNKRVKNCSTLRDLSNLKQKPDIFEKVMNIFTISVQGKEELNLKAAFDNNYDFLENISTDNLLEMLNGPCYIGGKKETLSDPYIQRNLSQNIIDITYLDKQHENTIIVLNYGNSFDKVKGKLSNCKIIDIEETSEITENTSHCEFHHFNLISKLHHFKCKSSFINTIYVSSKDVNDSEIHKLFSENVLMKALHYFKVLDDKCMQWVTSIGDISNLEEYKIINTHFIDEKSLLSTRLNKINLITGEPGIGKSELIKSFKNNCTPIYWTVIISPRDCYSYFANTDLPESSNHTNTFEKFIKNERSKSMNKLDERFFEMCVQNKQLIFIWDALDEVLNEHLEIVSKLILDLSEKDYLQWITTRQHLTTFLEKKFNVLSFTLSQFSEEEQEHYIRKRLESFVSVDAINITVETIKSTFVIIQHVNILGIPLQIFMLTELFRRNNDKYLKVLEQSFLLTDLYHYFIEEKFYIFYKDKIDFDLNNPHIRIVMNKEKQKALKHYEKLALGAIFPEDILRPLDIDFQKHVNKVLKKYTSVGLVYQFQDNVLHFLHSSFAEYLVAAYFSRNFKHIPTDAIFEARYSNIRFFFDMLIARTSPAHIAVLYRNFTSLREYDDETLTCKDEGGRSVLHVVCSWGNRHPHVTIERESGRCVVHSGSFNSQPETKEYLETVKFLQSKNDPDERDVLLDLKPLSYARKSESLGAELKLLQLKKSELDHLCTWNDRINILFYSSLLGYEEVCELFTVQNSNDLSEEVKFVTAETGATSLLLACARGNIKIVKYLVDSGADIQQPNNDGMTPLYIASRSGHEETVKFLLTSGIKINEARNNGWTALHAASLHGHEEILSCLVKSGAKINGTDNDGVVPLHLASQSGHQEIVELLVDNGAEINHAEKEGWTSLHLASENGHEKIVKHLLDNGAKINSEHGSGFSPLHLASRSGREKTVECLVKNGADINNDDNEWGFTPLIVAVVRKREDCVKSLVKFGARINHSDKLGCSPLHFAAYAGQEATIEWLVRAGANINGTTNNGSTPLHLASHSGHEKIAQLLVESGAEVNLRDENGFTPLHLASQKGHENAVQYLVEVGAEINRPNTKGSTPLHLSSSEGHARVTAYLVRTGADVNQEDNYGCTPLNFASVNGHRSTVKYLLSAGADVNHADNGGCTPLYLASQLGHDDVVHYLINAGVDVNCVRGCGKTPLHAASELGHEATVAYLVQGGAEVNRGNEDGWTPLQLAAKNGHESTVRYLVTSGAEINRANKFGWSALQLASGQGHEGTVEYLVRIGADVNQKDEFCWTPLNIAVGTGQEKCVKCLLSAGAEINHRDKEGSTPLHLAVQTGGENIVELLVKAGAEINCTNKYGRTAFHLALQRGHGSIVGCLVKAGAEVTCPKNSS